MHDSDYIKIYRNEINEPLFEDKELFRCWLWLRLSAAKKSRVQLVGKTRIRVKVDFGEYATSIKALAKKWEMDTRTVDDFLNHLAEDGLIKIDKQGIVTKITIVNYQQYAAPETEGCGETASSEMSGETQKVYEQLKSELKKIVAAGMSTEMLNAMRDEMRSLVKEEMQSLMQNGMNSRMQTSMPPQKSHLMQSPMQKSPSTPIVGEDKIMKLSKLIYRS